MGQGTFEVEEIESSVKYKNRRLTLVESKIKLPDGTLSTHVSIRHPGAVVLIPYSASGKLLMVRQYRHAVGRTLLEFPAGTLEAGEAPEACARREIQEEAGVAAAEWIDLGELIPTPGFCGEIQRLFFARKLTPSKLPGDEDEMIEVEELSTAEIEAKIASEEIVDAKSISIYFRAKLKGLV